LGTGFGEQSVVARSRTPRMKRSAAYASSAEQQMKAVLLYVHARARKDRRASAPLRPPIARVSSSDNHRLRAGPAWRGHRSKLSDGARHFDARPARGPATSYRLLAAA
jgi:hypothetical protein